MLQSSPRAMALLAMILGTHLAFGGNEPLPTAREAKTLATEQVTPANEPEILSIPEPATILLSCLGVLGLLLRRRP